MGYYMRYLTTSSDALTLDRIQDAIKEVDAAYHFEQWNDARDQAEFFHGQELYGEIALEHPEPGDEETVELMDDLEESEGDGLQRVTDVLKNVKTRVVVRVLWQGRQPSPTLEKLDPMWHWLLAHYPGLLQADGEGYYDADGEVLSVA